MVLASRWAEVSTHWIEAHPMRIVVATTGVIGSGLAVATEIPSAATAVGASMLAFAVSLITVSTRVILGLLRSERARTRELTAQIAAHTAQLTDDNHELRHRVAELERQLLGDGR